MTGDKSEREVAEAWIRRHLLPENSAQKDELLWAWEMLDDLIRHSPEEAWRIIELIRTLDGSDIILSNLGAGPLEDLLAKHGPAFIERIEEGARRDEQLRRVLGVVWRNEIRQDIWDRLKAIAGPSW
jgi:hypothetical protein